jgi:hypothetical protein
LATISQTEPARPKHGLVQPLESGDHLSAQEFERRYAATGPSIKADLVQGVVYVASPASRGHGVAHFRAASWLASYQAVTPFVEGSIEGTLRLDEQNQPQPDLHLRIPRECGGQSLIDDQGFIGGAPEFVMEIARSSVSFDLHDKLEMYRRHGVRECVAWRTDYEEFDWFVLSPPEPTPLSAGEDGLIRSARFPGLWLDVKAMIAGAMTAVRSAVDRGAASSEHAAFVQGLSRIAASQSEPPSTGGERP